MKLTRDKAFEKIINTRGVFKQLGLEKGVVANLRINHKLGKVSWDKMKEIVVRYEAKKIQDELWELPEE